MDRLRALDYDSVAGGLATTQIPWTHDGQDGVTTYTVQGAVRETVPDLKRVEVTVSWTDDVSHLVRLVTQVARE